MKSRFRDIAFKKLVNWLGWGIMIPSSILYIFSLKVETLGDSPIWLLMAALGIVVLNMTDKSCWTFSLPTGRKELLLYLLVFVALFGGAWVIGGLSVAVSAVLVSLGFFLLDIIGSIAGDWVEPKYLAWRARRQKSV